MEIKFDIVKPNLYIVEDQVYFAVDPSDSIAVSRIVDGVVRTHIGELKVKRADIEATISGKPVKDDRRYNVPLVEYLDVLQKNAKYRLDKLSSKMTNQYAQLFELSYLIDAQTIEDSQDINNWDTLQKILANSDESFDRIEKSCVCLRLDRSATLEQTRKLYGELDSRIPDNYAYFNVWDGCIQSGEHRLNSKDIGVVSFAQVKAKDKTSIETAKNELVERLNGFDGPCLSLDAPDIIRQIIDLFYDAPDLIRRYGDVLKSPNWKTRLFRLND